MRKSADVLSFVYVLPFRLDFAFISRRDPVDLRRRYVDTFYIYLCVLTGTRPSYLVSTRAFAGLLDIEPRFDLALQKRQLPFHKKQSNKFTQPVCLQPSSLTLTGPTDPVHPRKGLVLTDNVYGQRRGPSSTSGWYKPHGF